MKIFLAAVAYVGVAVLFMFVASGNDASAIMLLFDSPSVLFLGLGVLALAIIAFPLSVWRSGFALPFGRCEASCVHEAALFWHGVASFGLLSGVVAMVLGFMSFFQNLSNVSHLGPSLAVNLIPLCYGIMAYLLAKAVAKRSQFLDPSSQAKTQPVAERR